METLFLTLSLLRNLIFNSPVDSQEISLEPYCKNGYYEIPGEPICSRAPDCGGYTYDDLNKAEKMKDANKCVGNSAPDGKTGCAGYVPLCCYEVARTGDFTKCIGYWERLWCSKSQCETARSNGASDSQCGGNCLCSHAHGSYCGNKPEVPLSQRLTGATPVPTTPTTPSTQPTTQVPTPTTCTPPGAPIFTAPGGTTNPGMQDISWTPIASATKYALRIDDTANGWLGDCSRTQYGGDACSDNITGTSFKHNFEAGHTYNIWIHALNSCGGWDTPASLNVTVSSGASTTCVIQGYKRPTDQSNWNDTLSALKVNVPGFTQDPDTVNPYRYVVPGDQTYLVSIEQPQGYTITSTYCSNRTNCHTLSDSSAKTGSQRADVYCPAGGYADLWWHFTPLVVSTPTPRPTIPLGPGQCAGVRHCTTTYSPTHRSTKFGYCCRGNSCPPGEYPCTEPGATCTSYPDAYFFFDEPYAIPCSELNISPTPTITPTINPTLGCTQPTGLTLTGPLVRQRISESIDKVNVGWLPTQHNFLKVEISTDNQQTWETKVTGDEVFPTNEYEGFITNAENKRIYVRLTVGNACGQRGVSHLSYADPVEILAEVTPTAPVVPNVFRPEILLAGSLFIAILIGLFFMGL